jgi:hypothetical protein
MAIKSKREIDERMAFIRGEDKEIATQDDSLWSTVNLKKLDNYELLDRLVAVEEESWTIKAKLWWHLRQRFPSDKLFGQFILEIEQNPRYENFIGRGQQDRNRMLHAGRFLEANKVASLKKAGVGKSVVYLLSKPANAEVADTVFHQIRRKNMLLRDVERLVEQAKAVSTIEKAEIEPERMEYDKSPTDKYTVKVEGGIAQTDWAIDSEVEELGESIESVIEHESIKPEFIHVTQEQSVGLQIDTLKHEIVMDNEARRRRELLSELGEMDCSLFTQEQRIAEMVMLDKSYRMAELRSIADHQEVINRYKPTYKK